MPLLGNGVLAIWNGIAAEAEAEFVAWHVREHIPERVGVPGFLRGRRYVAEEDTTPKYFNFYETEGVAVLTSTAYMARLNAPSDWTRAVVKHFSDTSRTVCHVVHSRGAGEGGSVLTCRVGAVRDTQAFLKAVSLLADDAVTRPGIVAAHVLRGEDQASRTDTAEKAMRDQPDEVVDWIILVEAVGPAELHDLLNSFALQDRLGTAGAEGAVRSGVYRFQYALARADIEGRFVR